MLEGSGKSKTPLGRVGQHSLMVGGANHNFACFPKALPLVVVSSFPKALPLGEGMMGLQPVDRAGMVIVQDKNVGTELVRTVSFYELSLRTLPILSSG